MVFSNIDRVISGSTAHKIVLFFFLLKNDISRHRKRSGADPKHVQAVIDVLESNLFTRIIRLQVR